MSGVAGRSGGHNRKSTAEHLVNGTYRKDRHRKPASTPTRSEETAFRLADARELYAFHTGRHARLRGRMAEIDARQDAGEPIDGSRVLRELRAHADLLARLSATVSRLEVDAEEARTHAEANSDDWLAEFLAGPTPRDSRQAQGIDDGNDE